MFIIILTIRNFRIESIKTFLFRIHNCLFDTHSMIFMPFASSMRNVYLEYDNFTCFHEN